MRRTDTVVLGDVKTALRRGEDVKIENHGGWCVLVDLRARNARYVVDETADYVPVPYQKMRLLSDPRGHLRSSPYLNS